MELTINHNSEAKAYETLVDGQRAYVEYIVDKHKTFYFTHTEVPSALEGKGIASKLVTYALEDIEQQGSKVVALCPYVASFIRRKPEWKRLLR